MTSDLLRRPLVGFSVAALLAIAAVRFAPPLEHAAAGWAGSAGVVLTGCQTGATGHEQARRSMELFAREVLPHLRGVAS